jgi:chemotaxis protein methyltransferase CheR
LLRRRLLPELIDAAAGRGQYRLRFWSAGCATGEEAYTLAVLGLLALRDAGLAEETSNGITCVAPWEIDVLGSDISRQVVARGKAATYAAQELGSFRHLPAEFDRFFPVLPPHSDAVGIELRGVHEAIRRHVRFGQFNLMSVAPPETGFDIVLCRNVLIYLTVPARTIALSALQRALRTDGYLMLGPTDALADASHYEACWGEGAVAYRLKSGNG